MRYSRMLLFRPRSLFLLLVFALLPVSTALARRSGYADVNGTRLYYETAGRGPWIVLVHGGLVDHRLWDDQFKPLSKHFSVLRYDLRGYGRSRFPDKPFTHIDDLHALMKFLGIQKASFVGLSVGGNIAIEFVLAHPEMTEKLVLVGSSLRGSKIPRSEETNAIYATAEKSGMTQAVEMWLDNPLFATGKSNPKFVKRMRRMLADNYKYWGPTPQPIPEEWPTPPTADRVSGIKASTLIIVGSKDAENIRKTADMIAQKIAGSKITTIADVSHHLNMEKPDEFNRTVTSFLK